jgi:alkanesulfonate monooxygenase SsuD/methylene tetrahydromethanopterin reductase-like flavin-dependent oxidoreductase (luciferase family)
MWIGGSSPAAIRRTARIGTGWVAGAEPPAEAGRVAAAIRAATKELGRHIDDDHYGAGFAYYFGSPDTPIVQRAGEAYRKRTKRDPLTQFAVGDAGTILERIAAYADVGVTKLILRPLGGAEDEVLAQTKMLVDQVLPLVSARWPKNLRRTPD